VASVRDTPAVKSHSHFFILCLFTESEGDCVPLTGFEGFHDAGFRVFRDFSLEFLESFHLL
jgi:hypothetical protein